MMYVSGLLSQEVCSLFFAGEKSSREAVKQNKEDDNNHKWVELAGKKEDSLTSDGLLDKRCLYPSAAEERIRLLGKVPSQLRQELTECELSVQEIQAIVTAWSDVCSSFSIEEALMQMVMENGLEQEISKKQLLMLFKRHSATTILNIVVKSMKAGLWKSVLDTEKDPISNEMLNNDVTKSSNKEIFLRSSTEQTDKEELGFSSTCEEQPVRSLEQVLDVVVRVLHEVLMSVASTLNVCRPGQGMPNGQSFCFMLKNILTFEKDVVERLSLESFCKLKMGPFQTFIDTHLNKILKDCSKMCKSTALSVMCGMVVSDEGAQTFVSQVRKAVGIGEHLSHEFLMHLFAKQFQLQVLSGWWSIIIQDIADSPVCGNASSYSVLFSSALLASKRDCEDSLNGDVINDEDAVQICIRPQVGLVGSISSADARHCLLNAPMLCNLLRWSQWDSVFFPTLGLFPDWLKKEGPVEGLVCLVTSNGIYLRIDGSATIEKFLAAAVKGCGKQAAVQFVSVVAAYGGVDRVPLEVLKLYSQQAVEVLIGKSRLDFIAKTVATGYLEAIQGSSQGELISKWRQFFENLGVLDFVKVKCNSRKLHDKADVFWKRLPEHIKNESSLSVEDWECPELIEIVEGLCDACCDTPNKLKKLSDFVAAFDSLWDECYSKYSASCSEKEGLRVNVLLSFVLKLRSYAWVQSSFDGKLYKPTQLYHRCAAVESILGVHAPYAVPQMSSVRFAEALGLKMNVSVLDVLNVLTMWNRHSFKTSLSQMEKLYSFLRKETAQSEKDVRAFFQQNACIFVPDKIRASSKTRCKGRFYFVYELIWKDDSGCLAKLLHSSSDVSNLKICPKTLDLLYPTLRDFLVDVCQVKHTMEIGDYVNVLRMFAKQFSPSEVVTEVLAVFSKWSLDIDNRKLSFSALCKLKEVLHSKDSPILPTTQNKWVSLHSSEWLVCWCDDDVIGRQFSSSKIFYVCVGTSSAKGLIEAEVNSQIGQLLPFFKAMDILPLSKVVQQQPTICGAKWGKQIFDMLNWSFPYTQRYLRRWHRDIYKSLEQSSFDIRLRKIECFHTEKLSFCYRLPRNLGLGTEQLEVDYLLQGEKFYGTNVKNLKALYLEFSKIYFDGTSDMKLADFLHLIASAFQSGSDVTELESLLTWEGIGPCSDLDKEWRLKSSSENKAQLETGCLKHSADHHVKEKESNQVQDLANNRINDKCHRSAVDNVAVCKRSLAVLMNQGGAGQHAKTKESKQVQVKLPQNLAKNRMDDKCYSSAVDNVAVCKRSLAAPMNQGGAEQHAKQKESKQVQEKLSQDLPSNIIDDECHSAAVDSVAVCKRSLAALMNQGESKELEATGKRSRSSSTTKVAPPVIESGLGHSGKKSEVLKYADDVVALQADGRGAKVCEIDPCKNKNDKVGGPCVITNFPSDSSLAGLKVQRDRCDNKPQFVSLSRKDQIFFGDPCKEQAFLTGRLGEAVVFSHLMENYGTNRVLWINEEMERGFPYDIAVEESDGQQLHVEVKATWSENKDWFEISNQEWEFAARAGDKYIIVRVFFSGSSGSARFVWLRNPVKLCQDKRVRLALIVPS
ncbi:hypothetical protein GOP47_0009269 [Adiantum capillus-veneris]|uniref:Protein NO VEIN C-terminal domain-containing protein n=1 Tax=Adiantum capillus-veneris TaxID=13818 RepID=A0A9D4UW95_ADICA|nr:hypothetical protein GOP47_0009269 [Adiantum capillus-veneris]